MTEAAQAETMGRELGKLRVVFSGNGKMPRREEVVWNMQQEHKDSGYHP